MKTQVKGEIHVLLNVEDCSTGPAPGAQGMRTFLAPLSADESPLRLAKIGSRQARGKKT